MSCRLAITLSTWVDRSEEADDCYNSVCLEGRYNSLYRFLPGREILEMADVCQASPVSVSSEVERLEWVSFVGDYRLRSKLRVACTIVGWQTPS